jgi:hypothetical protein
MVVSQSRLQIAAFGSNIKRAYFRKEYRIANNKNPTAINPAADSLRLKAR